MELYTGNGEEKGVVTKRVKCIECGAEYNVPTNQPIIKDQFGIVTNTICNLCYILLKLPRVRARQSKAGFFDCFVRAVNGYCDQTDCRYRLSCLSPTGVQIARYLSNCNGNEHEAISMLHILPLIRKMQRKEGNLDCFLKCGDNCGQAACSYKALCLSSLGKEFAQLHL